MRSRILVLLLVTLLALPMTAVMPPVQASTQRQELAASTLAAKKKHKKARPRFRTVRQPIAQTFSSAGAIAIPAINNGDPTGSPANPYPSVLDVTGFTNGVITDVNLTLNGFSHTAPDDVDVLLAATHLPGQNAIVLSDVGWQLDALDLNLMLDDQATAALPDNGPLVSGTFLPTNFNAAADGVDLFSGVTPSGNIALSVFNGSNPNGSWQLFVVDDLGGDKGSISSWTLQITAEVDVQVKVKKDKKKGGKKGKH